MNKPSFVNKLSGFFCISALLMGITRTQKNSRKFAACQRDVCSVVYVLYSKMVRARVRNMESEMEEPLLT